MTDASTTELFDTSVRLAIPARSRYLRLARLTAAGIASDLGFSLQAIEDLRVSVDEACAILIEGCSAEAHDRHEIELVYGVVGDKLLVEGVSNCAAAEPVEIHPVARELLDMTADEYEVASDGASRRFRLVKHRQDAGV